MIFDIKKGKATKIYPKGLKNELELHDLIDNNLFELFEIRFIKKEHITDTHGRIETLGLDSSNCPVVIEYKKSMEKGQLAQANRYVDWINKYPHAFELLVRDHLNIKVDIDFANTRIICFAQEYNMDDKCLAPKLGAELWKYTYYENETLVIVREGDDSDHKVKAPKTKTSAKSISLTKEKRAIREVRTVEEQLDGVSKELRALFYNLDNEIRSISSEIECYTNSIEICYKTSTNFLTIAIQKKKNCLRLHLRTRNDKISDPKNLTTKVPENYRWGNVTRMVYVEPKGMDKKHSLSDILSLILQSYNVIK